MDGWGGLLSPERTAGSRRVVIGEGGRGSWPPIAYRHHQCRVLLVGIVEIVGDRGRSALAAVVRFVKRLRDQRVGNRSRSGTRDDNKAAHIAE